MQTTMTTKLNSSVTTHRSASLLPSRKASIASRRVIVRAEEPKVTREYREGDDSVVNASQSTNAPQANSNPNSVYADELPEIKRAELSDAMKEKMRREYYGLGGSPNKPMSGNYFLYIILIISLLAILSSVLGYI